MKIWGELHERRWAWVDQPVASFRESCDASLGLQHHLDTSESEYNAVLFGRTQVGKTTLMLRLLGLSDSGFGHVAGVLRGGRTIGRSATASPTRYQWSSEHDLWQFRIVEPHTVTEVPLTLSEAGITQRLAALRDPSGAPVRLGGVVEVGIPRRYRLATSRAAFARVLDLPGAAADTQAEREIAEALIRLHVPAAHLVIMVVQADALVKELGSGLAASMPQLSMWTDVPERFRIVFTRVYSSDSIRSRLLADADFRTSLAVRSHLFEQLRTTDLPLTDDAGLRRRIQDVFHPLEYGDSWELLRTQHPEVYDIADGLVEQELDRLSQCLIGAEAEDMRRIGLVRAASTVEIVTRRRIQEHEDAVDRAESRLDDYQRELPVLQAKATRAHDEITRTQGHLSSLETIQPPPSPVLDRPHGSHTGEATRKEGRDFARQLEREWTTAWGRWAASPLVSSAIHDAGAPETPDYSKDDFTQSWACVSQCGESCTSQRWKFWRAAPNACHDRQMQAASSAESLFELRTRQSVDSWKAETQDRLQRALAEERRLSQQLSTAVRELEAEIDHWDGVANAARAELQTTSDKGRDAIERSKRLGRELAESLEAEVGLLNSRGENAATDEDRLAYGLAIALALANAERLTVQRQPRRPASEATAPETPQVETMKWAA